MLWRATQNILSGWRMLFTNACGRVRAAPSLLPTLQEIRIRPFETFRRPWSCDSKLQSAGGRPPSHWKLPGAEAELRGKCSTWEQLRYCERISPPNQHFFGSVIQYLITQSIGMWHTQAQLCECPGASFNSVQVKGKDIYVKRPSLFQKDACQGRKEGSLNRRCENWLGKSKGGGHAGTWEEAPCHTGNTHCFWSKSEV